MDGVQSLLKSSGVPCVDMDIANVGSHCELKEHNDLSSDHLWETVLNDIRTGQVKALWFGRRKQHCGILWFNNRTKK